MKSKFTLFSFLSLITVGLISCGPKPHVHSYDFDDVKWNWNETEDGFNADVTLTCKDCLEEIEGHSLKLNAEVTSETKSATCEVDGSITYTATAVYEEQTLTDTKIISLDKLGHDYKTISLSGDYETTYNALDTFDTEHLVVTATCGREGCGKTKTLTADEYFVIYQTSGADHFCAGDTKVVISAGFARAEIKNLTVTKIENTITGMEDSYETTCGIAPDLSGVSSAADNLVIKYYSDSECTQEVDVSSLEVGDYFIKATSGDQNYNEVSKVATLTVSHLFDQCIQDDEYICSPSTKFQEATYYKSCACGESSNSSSLTFEGSQTKLPEKVAESCFASSQVVEMEAPEGYTQVSKNTVTFNNDNQGQTFLNDIYVAPIEDTITFKILTKNRKLCNSSWEICIQMDTWYTVEITKDSDLRFSSIIKDDTGAVMFGYQNKSSIPETLPYYNYDGDAENMEIYSTEVYGLRCSDETFEVIASSSTVNDYTVVDMMSPKGFQTVTKGKQTFNNDDQGHYFLADIAMDNYESLSFGFYTENRKFSLYDWSNCVPMNSWNFVTIERNKNGLFTSTIYGSNGLVLTNITDAKSFREALPYYNYDGDAPKMVWYSTEVRGVLKQSEPLQTVVIDENVICGNGATTTPTIEAAPYGFTNVGYWTTTSDFMHGMLYSGTDLSNYSSVSFAIKTSGYFIFDGWGTVVDNFLWTIFTLTNNGNNTWNMVAKNLKGETIYTIDNLSSYKGTDPGVYTNYALNTILYGIPGTGYIPSQKSGTEFVVYATELRGVAK